MRGTPPRPGASLTRADLSAKQFGWGVCCRVVAGAGGGGAARADAVAGIASRRAHLRDRRPGPVGTTRTARSGTGSKSRKGGSLAQRGARVAAGRPLTPYRPPSRRCMPRRPRRATGTGLKMFERYDASLLAQPSAGGRADRALAVACATAPRRLGAGLTPSGPRRLEDYHWRRGSGDLCQRLGRAGEAQSAYAARPWFSPGRSPNGGFSTTAAGIKADFAGRFGAVPNDYLVELRSITKLYIKNYEHANKYHICQPYMFFRWPLRRSPRFYRQALGAGSRDADALKDSPEPARCGSGSGRQSSCTRQLPASAKRR